MATEEKLNPRTKRVRDALTEAAFELVSERPVEDISLTEVAKAAGVSRPTVYKQFNDTASLVAEATVDSLERILADNDPKLAGIDDERAYFQKLMRLFVEGVYANRDFYRNAAYGPSTAQIMTGTTRMLDDRMRTRHVGQRLAGSGVNVDDFRAAIAAGVVWLLIRWLGTDFTGDNTPDCIADRIANALYVLSEPEAGPGAEPGSAPTLRD